MSRIEDPRIASVITGFVFGSLVYGCLIQDIEASIQAILVALLFFCGLNWISLKLRECAIRQFKIHNQQGE